MKKLMLVAVLFLNGCSLSTESFFEEGRLHCINGYLYLVMGGVLVVGMDENDNPARCPN